MPFIIRNIGNQMGSSPQPHHCHHTAGLSDSQDPTAPDGPSENERSGRNVTKLAQETRWPDDLPGRTRKEML